jgi:hypothetical protein
VQKPAYLDHEPASCSVLLAAVGQAGHWCAEVVGVERRSRGGVEPKHFHFLVCFGKFRLRVGYFKS